jgi:hypothetical protein
MKPDILDASGKPVLEPDLAKWSVRAGRTAPSRCADTGLSAAQSNRAVRHEQEMRRYDHH